MISDSIEYKDAESAKEFFSSPVDASPNRGGDASCGLSTTTSESSSQPNSWTSRDDSPNSKTPGSFSSYMPIVDEDDCRAPDSRDGNTSSEEEQPATPSTAIAAFHKAAYDSQVRRWQQEELQYMRHEGWCEHRVVLLLQEAFRCSYVNLKQAHAEGLLAADVFAARTAELKTSLATIKKEYRRTLARTHERRGDVASIASKAVACVASVYPWSSSGFVLGFEENLRYADLAGLASGSARRGAAAAAVTGCAARPAETAPPSAPTVAAVPMPQLEADVDEDDDTGIAESVIAGGRSRRIATPRVTLQPLPPRRQLFQRGTAPLSPAPTTASPSAVVVATAPVDVAARTVAASPPPTGTRSPMTLPPASTAGPLRPGEARFLEKRQLVVHGMAFVSRSLASTTFIASRRATIAAATMRHRLGLVKEAEVEEAPAEEEDEEESQMSSTPASFVSRRLMKPPQQEQQPQPRPQQPRPSVVGAAAPVPSLPTRYISDLSSTPCEAAAFDSNPSSLTRRSNPSSVTKRAVLANPASYAAPPPPPPLPVANAANTPRSVTGTVTKRAMKPVSGNSGGCGCTTLPPGVPNNSGMRSQPHSYTGRVSHVPTVVPSQPHSYTTRSVQLPMTALTAAGAMPTPVYVATPCQTFRVDPQDCVMVAAGVPPAYCTMAAAAGPPPPPTDYGATYAPPSAPPPPPAYTSHVRRDRLRPPAAPFNGAYGAVPPVSVEDEQYVKELW